MNATWILLRTLTYGAYCQNGDHAARGGAEASATSQVPLMFWEIKSSRRAHRPVVLQITHSVPIKLDV